MKIIFSFLISLFLVSSLSSLSVKQVNSVEIETFFHVQKFLKQFKLKKELQDEIAIAIARNRGCLSDDDIDWVMIHMFCESSFRPDAVGDSFRSFGLLQIQIPTARLILRLLGENWDRVSDSELRKDLLNVYFNIYLGLSYLKILKKEFGDIRKAIVVYNAGRLISKSKHLRRVEEIYSELRRKEV